MTLPGVKRRVTFVPALGHPLLARLYDPLLRLSLRERAFKSALVRQAATRRFEVPLGTVSLYYGRKAAVEVDS